MSARPLSDLLSDIEARRLDGRLDIPIVDVCFDSRQATAGSLFVALPGGYTDGHHYLAQARELGAVAALVERWDDALNEYPAVVQVDDTRATLPSVAATFFERPANSLGLIGVTGTDGKTTTSFLIDAMLRHAGRRTGVIGTVAIRIADEVVDHDLRQTTPESLEIQRMLARMRDAEVDWAVLEATSHGLALHRLDECPFDIGVVTNITHEHLEFHKTIEAYRRAKARLLESVAASQGRRWPNGVAINADDEGARSIVPFAGSSRVISFSSRSEDADIIATGIQMTAGGTDFRLTTPRGGADVQLKLIGRFNVDNALAAASAGHLIGMAPAEIAEGLATLDGVPGRLRRVDLGQPFSVIVDYAHTPDSLEKTLTLVRGLVRGRLIAVFGSAGERDRTKRPLQGAVSARLADFSIFTSEDPRFEDPDEIIAEIAGGAQDSGKVEGRDYLCIEDRRLAIRSALGRAQSGDAIVLAGKGHEHCMIYGSERRPWDETEEAMRALQELGYRLVDDVGAGKEG